MAKTSADPWPTRQAAQACTDDLVDAWQHTILARDVPRRKPSVCQEERLRRIAKVLELDKPARVRNTA